MFATALLVGLFLWEDEILDESPTASQKAFGEIVDAVERDPLRWLGAHPATTRHHSCALATHGVPSPTSWRARRDRAPCARSSPVGGTAMPRAHHPLDQSENPP